MTPTFKKVPKCWGMYTVYDGSCLLGQVSRDPVDRGGRWKALPSSSGAFLGPFKTRGAAGASLLTTRAFEPEKEKGLMT